MTRARLLSLLGALCLAALALSLMAGKIWVPASAWFGADPRWWIIINMRLPRGILALAIGAVLGLSGAVLQGYVRNPLADPSLVGVSASAALGAVLAIDLGFGATLWAVAGAAMIAAAGAVLLIAALMGRSGSATGFILAGTILSSLAGALTAFIISIAPNPFASSAILGWLMGALTDRGSDELIIAAPFMLAGSLILLGTARALDVLSLGEEVARSMGVDLARLQGRIALGLGLAIGAAVAVSGVVGFVGLIVPHLMRPVVGSRPSALLIPSALGGALLVMVADSLCRIVPGAAELRLGVAMSLIGAPFFVALLVRYRRRLT